MAQIEAHTLQSATVDISICVLLCDDVQIMQCSTIRCSAVQAVQYTATHAVQCILLNNREYISHSFTYLKI
jgi:hypothetical protein